jgi:hypothetical protein
VSIPIASFASSLKAHDLEVDLSGCDTNGAGISATLDGVDGSSLSDSSDLLHGFAAFRWAPFPTDPQTLTLTFTGQGCEALLSFGDAVCDANHQPPDCPL